MNWTAAHYFSTVLFPPFLPLCVYKRGIINKFFPGQLVCGTSREWWLLTFLWGIRATILKLSQEVTAFGLWSVKTRANELDFKIIMIKSDLQFIFAFILFFAYLILFFLIGFFSIANLLSHLFHSSESPLWM